MSESTYRSVFRNVCLSKSVQVIKEYDLYYPKLKIRTLATRFNVGCSQIRNILFNKEAILNAYEESSKTVKNVSPNKSKSKLQDNPKTVEDDNDLGVLGVSDRINPKPINSSLTTKYGASSHHISNVLLRQGISTEEETMRTHNQRLDQIRFLGMVMYEYLQRALYHNVPLDDLQFQKKAAEVIECIAITKFRPSYLWLKGFKKRYDIDDLSLESLRNEIVFTDEKESSLNAVDMVRFVREHKSALLKSESELINQPSKSKHAKVYTLQLGENNDPEFVYKRDSVGILKASADISPAQLNEYSGPQLVEENVLAVVPANKTQNSSSVLENLEQHFKKPGQSGITVIGRKSKVGKVINEWDLSQNISRNLPSPLLSEEDEFVTIFQIVDDEAPTSPAANKNHCSSPPLSCIDNNSPNPDLSGNTVDNITIKTEPELLVDNDKEELATIDKQSSTYILPNRSPQLCLSANNCEGMIMKTETSSIELDEDIKPTIMFERSEEFIIENNISTIDNYHPPRLAIGKRFRSNSPLPDVLGEDIKPTIIYESDEEFLMETTNSPSCQQHSTMLPIDKRARSYSIPLPDVLGEDIKPPIVFEKCEEFITENNNASNDHHHSPRLAAAKLPRLNSPLPDIDTPEEAMKLLKVLENYALLSDNYRAIGLLTNLEKAFKESPMLQNNL